MHFAVKFSKAKSQPRLRITWLKSVPSAISSQRQQRCSQIAHAKGEDYFAASELTLGLVGKFSALLSIILFLYTRTQLLWPTTDNNVVKRCLLSNAEFLIMSSIYTVIRAILRQTQTYGMLWCKWRMHCCIRMQTYILMKECIPLKYEREPKYFEILDGVCLLKEDTPDATLLYIALTVEPLIGFQIWMRCGMS